MKNKTNTLLISVAVIILLALLAALGFAVYQSYAYKADIAAAEAAARDAAALASRQAVLERDVAGSRADLAAIDARFVPEADVSVFIGMLEGVAAAEGVSANVGSINLEAAAGAGGLKSLRLRIDGTGSWAEVVGFISALESLPYALRVSTASVSSIAAADAPAGAWRFSADISQFVSI